MKILYAGSFLFDKEEEYIHNNKKKTSDIIYRLKMYLDNFILYIRRLSPILIFLQAHRIAVNFIKDGLSPEMISRNTSLDLEVVEELSERIAKEKSQETMPV